MELGGRQKHHRARKDYEEETANDSNRNVEPYFQSGLGDSVD